MDHKLPTKGIASLFVVLYVLGCSANVNAGWPKKKKKPQPTPTVVLPVVEAKPAPAPAPPANGSLFTDNAPNASLITNFKAQHVGDLVFIDVSEISTATVSSNASRSRDSGTAAGLSAAVAALRSPTAPAMPPPVIALPQPNYHS